MKSFLRVGLMLFLSAEYYFCASEKYENTTSRVIERRTIGGRLAEKGEFPFLVAIYKNRTFRGAFSLITTRTLIGAAHIVEEYTVKDYYGRIGNVDKQAGKRVLFRRRIIHGRYDSKTLHNDIALLILARSINNISPIALVGKNLRFTKGSATFVGWGRTGIKKDDRTDLLRVAKVNFVDPKYVGRNFDYELTYKEITTMSSRVKGMKGDSGSPLIKRDASKRPVLIGILSSGGDNIREPDVYMSISFYHHFIKTHSVGRLTYLDVQN
ncbi:venom peptide isomerase heavy chain-like [Centruroides sculpturatus]|uniref:venom peptide isomerase heavy chain-like n=1 Tax=Centruroides sculpturatus TaxID=218467 RepID=UPI000C6DBCE7|nr:venom peptide isomerase heavy chain-like [Centruroides sculpturatus]XP_023230426.1 venom peptide isomerase heavy chain-like [Centruroides sculpturatus]XP_023230427.1 venom peptide isomerase heavy chain-like [Centruroides sculpturatus]